MKLSQVFINEKIAREEAKFANSNDVVLEVGSGKLNLTKFLCQRAKYVVAIEKDKKLFEISLKLAKNKNIKNLEIWNKDFLKLGKEDYERLKELGTNKIISNPPYHISSKILIKTYEVCKEVGIKEVYYALQKEFVEHLLATSGKKYSRISVFANLHFEINQIFEIKKENFNPVPKVDSIFIQLKPKYFELEKEKEEIINLLMQQKKKTLKNAIRIAFGIEETKNFKEELLKKRVFNLSPNELVEIATIIKNSKKQR
jgi:16S rRNA (adenine1518-N6/adenine1519-N6)-dimethyltransferase